MIEGFQIEISSSEMMAHTKQRADYHAERALWYSAQAEQLAHDVPRIPGNSTDPHKNLLDAGARHKSKAEVFAFIASHVPKDETYRLDENDLSRLEFIKERLY